MCLPCKKVSMKPSNCWIRRVFPLPILIDERNGRMIAQQKRLIVTGFAGLLTLAVKKEILPPAKALHLLDQAFSNGFRLSDRLYQQGRNAFLPDG